MSEKKYPTVEEIKPCPFCGSDAESEYAMQDRNTHGVYCIGCEASMDGFDFQEQAIKAWNTRHQPLVESACREIAAQSEDIRELESKLSACQQQLEKAQEALKEIYVMSFTSDRVQMAEYAKKSLL